MIATLNDLQRLKNAGKKFALITAYDCTFARIFSRSGVSGILVGDSLGMTIQGADSTLNVSMADMIYHTKCVRTGAPDFLILSDLPFMSYHSTDQAIKNSARLMRAGANAVKMEGGGLSDITRALSSRSIPVCNHIGLTPQLINDLGSYRARGKEQNEVEQLISDATDLERAGSRLIVLENIQPEVARIITENLKIPTVGIGSGSATDGQIMVMQDILGISERSPPFARSFLSGETIITAVTRYVSEMTGENLRSSEDQKSGERLTSGEC